MAEYASCRPKIKTNRPRDEALAFLYRGDRCMATDCYVRSTLSTDFHVMYGVGHSLLCHAAFVYHWIRLN